MGAISTTRFTALHRISSECHRFYPLPVATLTRKKISHPQSSPGKTIHEAMGKGGHCASVQVGSSRPIDLPQRNLPTRPPDGRVRVGTSPLISEIWPYVCAHIQMFGQHPRVLKRKQKEYLAWMMRDTLPAKLVKKPPQAARAAAAGVKRA